jgi:hypothetical protein
MMNRRIPVIIAPLLVLNTATGWSQLPNTAQTRAQAQDTLQTLQAQLENKRAQRQSMERMIASLNTVDSVYKASFPKWIVLDEDLRERVYKSFDGRFANVRRDTDVIVVGSPDLRQILELSVGNQTMGRRDVAVNLSDSLYHELISMHYPLREFTPVPPRPKARTQFGVVPRFAAISASAFGVTMLFANGMGFEAKMGREELGYHFWSTGDLRILGIYGQFKLGINVPFAAGLPTYGTTYGPLSILPRKMMGARGVVTEYEYQLPSASFGAHISVSENSLLWQSSNLFIHTGDSLYNYYVHTVLQGWYTHNFRFGTYEEHTLSLTAGFGYHQIGKSRNIYAEGRIVTTDKQDFYSPLLRVNYTHEGANSFGLNVQYYNSVILAHGWVEFVKNFLYVDLEYYTPVLRAATPWEQRYFFMISPRIQVIY